MLAKMTAVFDWLNTEAIEREVLDATKNKSVVGADVALEGIG